MGLMGIKLPDFGCLNDICRAPLACWVFGYCRQRNFDGRDMDKAECERRYREQRESDQLKADLLASR
jgi:hypothetical protein